MLHLFRKCDVSLSVENIKSRIGLIEKIETEDCYNISLNSDSIIISPEEKEKLLWLLSETFCPECTREESFLQMSRHDGTQMILEVGPRLAFTTAWSSSCVSMCHACEIDCVNRIERSRRYLINSSVPLLPAQVALIESLTCDRMTETVYHNPLSTFEVYHSPLPVQYVPVLTEGRQALEAISIEMGLGFDEWDLDYYLDLFCNKLGRNPSDVECFDLAQSNSEHSRHWFFGGKIYVDGQPKDCTLFSMVKDTLRRSAHCGNSIIAFHDNSSAIKGFDIHTLAASDPTTASLLHVLPITMHPILTAETHNFPCGIAPFPGAETGTGGRLRDVQATGRGAHTLAGICGYCVGNLHMPEHPLPWEIDPTGSVGRDKDRYSSTLALPVDILVQASNGASDYGNKYGEPVVCGFTRSFGQRMTADDRRVEWIKPIMFTAGVGMLDDRHAVKRNPEVGMVVCKIGGPAYRIGLGGGAASSRGQGTVDAALDFNAVQRGDAEMENRMNRFVRSCVELGDGNPIMSIHDQGAGGNGNVLKEIVEPRGAIYELRDIPLGDPTLSVVEIWGSEYQENNAILVRPECLELVKQLAERENCPLAAVGTVTGDGRVVLRDAQDGSTPFDLPLSFVLGSMPQKEFHFTSPNKRHLVPLTLRDSDGRCVSVSEATMRVLQLIDVGSKRFLTNKVDRSVSGLVAQQQCVGPLHTPLSDVAVLAQSFLGLTGIATAIGEQPIKGLVDSAAQARMTVGEALTNLIWAKVTSLGDVKASCNWMWAAKLDKEGAKMWDCCEAIRDILVTLGPSIDGGKDSLSMVAQIEGEVVVSPGEVTLTVYAACPDITKTVTPDLKAPHTGQLLFVDLSGHSMGGSIALGGTALSTVYGQLGDACADVRDPMALKRAFEVVQLLLDERMLLAGHDRSDGGLMVCLLEMAFAGNCGVTVDVTETCSRALLSDDPAMAALETLFNEELGLVVEVLPHNMAAVMRSFAEADVVCTPIGVVEGLRGDVTVIFQGECLLQGSVARLRDIWEGTSFALERRQCNVICVDQERQSLLTRQGPTYRVTFDVPSISPSVLVPSSAARPRVAIIRQEGSNGDREMLAAFHMAGMDAWDVNMRDLTAGRVTLSRFRGIVFCGGFSYADVTGSAKGWAGVIKYHPALWEQFEQFRQSPHTFSLGVCNGCQLMTLLGWVPGTSVRMHESSAQTRTADITPLSIRPEQSRQIRLVHNTSGRFESRWSAVRIMPSNAVLLCDMEDSVLGVWSAHGEGRMFFPADSIDDISVPASCEGSPVWSGIQDDGYLRKNRQLQWVKDNNLAPIRYVDDAFVPTTAYPMNPNGSPDGIAALCSEDGRHLAIMPHPERCFLRWQWPHSPLEWMHIPEDGSSVGVQHMASPWAKLFQNAYKFCTSE